MAFEKINADDTLNQGRIKINNILDDVKSQVSQFSESISKVSQLSESITEIGVADESAFTIVQNKYCDSGSLNIYDSNGYAVTEPYLLKKGSKLVVKTKGLNALLSVVSICNQDNTERICLIRSIDSTKRTYTYIAPSDMYVCLSFAMDDYSIKIYDLKNKEIEATKTAIKANDDPFIVSKIRQMIYNNSYTEHTNYCCSTPIKLTKGQKLEVTMRCESAVSAISKVNQDGTLISAILKGKGISKNNYSYVAESDCFVILSFYVSKDYPEDFNCIVYYPVYDIIEANGFDVVDSMSFSMFERWGVIGDSFASGVYYDISKGALDNHLQKSWGQILARKSGNACVNFSMGGLYCGNWLTNNDRGLPFLLRESAKELYIVALGINDVGRLSGVQPLGSISDIHSDFSQNPNTFYGNYGKIIGNIKNHAPKAKIIMSTIPYNGENAMIINNAIIAIAQHFELPCLMVHSDKFFRSDFYWDNFEQDHPKSFLYGATANAYERLVIENMRDNTSYWGDTFN